MPRAAPVGKLAEPSRESLEQADPVLYKQLVPPRTLLLSKTVCSCSVPPRFFPAVATLK